MISPKRSRWPPPTANSASGWPSERALDAAFANALASVELPETLREDILGCLAGERGDFPQARGRPGRRARSARWPRSSRRRNSARKSSPPWTAARAASNAGPRPFWRRLGLPLAAAAGIALAFLIARPKSGTAAGGGNEPLPVDVVQAGFIRTFESPLFSLDEKREDHQALIANLEIPLAALPVLPAARTRQREGRRLPRTGHRWQTRIAHLLRRARGRRRPPGRSSAARMSRGDLPGARPPGTSPAEAAGPPPAGSTRDNVFILIGNTDVRKLAALF